MNIQFYGAAWCGDCRRAKAYLDERGAKYDYIDIEQDPAAADMVVSLTKGFRSIPTIVFPNGKVLIEPSNVELEPLIAELENNETIVKNNA
ncbi:NrdH-redoxin [Candidatus Woesebacteria bacterium]|nr:NrdH-redoxin [Candidatus Woesebacteria bacterium]